MYFLFGALGAIAYFLAIYLLEERHITIEMLMELGIIILAGYYGVGYVIIYAIFELLRENVPHKIISENKGSLGDI